MTVEEIIRMFDNPAMIGEALIEAAKLTFSGEHKMRFEQKRLRYIDGLRDHERPVWVGEMKNLLSLCIDTDDLSDIKKPGNYRADALNRWHYLDKQELRRRVKEMCRKRDIPVKVLFIENNTDAFSDYTDEILRSFIKADHQAIHQTLTETKGEMSHVLYLEHGDQIRDEWTDLMERSFGLSAACEKISEAFQQKGLHRQSHIIVHSVDQLAESFSENFQLYYNLWTTLLPEQPIFLCIHLPEQSLPREEAQLPYGICCYSDRYDMVTHLHFTRFFKDFKCYHRDEELCTGDSMSFRDAVKKLHYCQP